MKARVIEKDEKYISLAIPAVSVRDYSTFGADVLMQLSATAARDLRDALAKVLPEEGQ